jgi:hypothetical protein
VWHGWMDEYKYVCMCVCMYVCMYVCTSISMAELFWSSAPHSSSLRKTTSRMRTLKEGGGEGGGEI